MPAIKDSLWTAQGTTPSEIEAALREMLGERHAEHSGYTPARVLNLVCVVDRQWSGEIANRLRNVGDSHASRTIVCAVEPGRTTLDAVATIASDREPGQGEFALTRETIVVNVGPSHLSHLDTIVDPLVVTDIPTVLWAPHGHHRAIESLRRLAQVIMLDSVDDPEVSEALARADSLAAELDVVDMAWLRTLPWRERLAATFDPEHLRPQLAMISSVDVRHQPDSMASAFLLLGWLASRLDWQVSPLLPSADGLRGSAHAHRQDVMLTLTPAPQMQVRGLLGLTVETASGRRLSLDRGPGGLRAHYSNERKHIERSWTVLGASRGEGGILANAIRAALARDRVYLPALRATTGMVR
jgi:glucose-6-phosphate dehydrogenase assembly protein OpcA